MSLKCEICGKKFDTVQFAKPFDKICSDECFDKKFWNTIAINKDKYLISNGECYCTQNDSYKGFDGKTFQVLLLDKDGTVTESFVTNNLWHKGTVPAEYRSMLKDNCIILGI